ncbi:LysR family transcriptional regulator [Gemmata sp.]|uniref:LysR family transcriptional regulator n=1 Tax=Gemmata sp. TaxID=1914242 RepID=UPI003F6FDA30
MPTPYKETSLAQLRGFCETARLGSFSAAAAALGVAQPTVWKLVHALEKHLGRKLFEVDNRGCVPTEAGRLLHTLAASCLTNVDGLAARLGAALDAAEVRVTVAGTPRQLGEDLVPCVAEFVRANPRVRFAFLEMDTDEVAGAVDDGRAQIGFTPAALTRKAHPRLTCDPWYALDVLLVVRTDHPLARRRRVRLRDLAGHHVLFPEANLRDFPNPAALAALRLHESGPQWVEARQANVLRRCVLHGLGSLLLLGRAGDYAHPDLTERVLSPEVGKSSIFLVRRAGVDHHPAVGAFAEAVRRRLSAGGTGPPAGPGRRPRG